MTAVPIFPTTGEQIDTTGRPVVLLIFLFAVHRLGADGERGKFPLLSRTGNFGEKAFGLENSRMSLAHCFARGF